MTLDDLFNDDTGVLNAAMFGSRVVGCATDTSDYDYLVLVENRKETLPWWDMGFKPDIKSPLYSEDFSSWNRESINLVITDDKDYFDVTLEATWFCKKYKVFDKTERCKIHEAFRDQHKFLMTLNKRD